MSTTNLDPLVTCPGCGGRNPPGATECDWCGRPFTSKRRRLQLTVWQILSSLFLLALIGAVAALAVLNAGRSLPVRARTPTSTSVPTIQPTPAVTPRVTAAPVAGSLAPPPPTPTPLPVAPPPPAPTPEPSPTPQRLLARIANTSGQGVSVRVEPGPQAARIGVLREGTRVVLTGNDSTVAARPWREVETEDRGVKGWVLADFLQISQPTP